jgi:hypothetical protein
VGRVQEFPCLVLQKVIVVVLSFLKGTPCTMSSSSPPLRAGFGLGSPHKRGRTPQVVGVHEKKLIIFVHQHKAHSIIIITEEVSFLFVCCCWLQVLLVSHFTNHLIFIFLDPMLIGDFTRLSLSPSPVTRPYLSPLPVALSFTVARRLSVSRRRPSPISFAIARRPSLSCCPSVIFIIW